MIKIRSHPGIVGFRYRNVQEKVMYTDDTLCMLADTNASLRETMAIIKEYSVFSGLNINWSKYALMLIVGNTAQIVTSACPIPLTSLFKYLGVQVSPDPRDFCHLNITLPFL